MYLTTSLALAGLLAVPVSAFWRLPCVSPLVQERADPIVDPGVVAGHLHTIMGGNGFDFTMTNESAAASTCSSCTVQGDFSNYWTPVLFYQHQNGSFEKVDQVGGALVYYLQRNAPGETIHAFPKGFRMVAGDPFKRSGGSDAATEAISYNCLNYNGPAQPETNAFPTSNCPSGLRSQVFFPSCWDGTNVDSSDHKSHVSYPDGAYNDGTCPSTHPVRLVSIFYEIIWDTNKFADMWYGNTQPFVWSMGDPTGYGLHGDFINGWNVSLLQTAVDTCTNDSGRVEDCPAFKLTPDSESNGCKVPDKVDEPITGMLNALPGCNPVQPGPTRATAAASCNTSGFSPTIQSTTDSIYFTDLTSQKWSYLGCATDNYYNRSLIAATTSSADMTNEICTSFCMNQGYTYAATEYAKECYCGNNIPADRLPVPGIVGNCDMPCTGNASEWCGGTALMSLYQRCADGTTCTNAQIGVGGSQSSDDIGHGSDSVSSSSPSVTAGLSGTATSINTGASASASPYVPVEAQVTSASTLTSSGYPSATAYTNTTMSIIITSHRSQSTKSQSYITSSTTILAWEAHKRAAPTKTPGRFDLEARRSWKQRAVEAMMEERMFMGSE